MEPLLFTHGNFCCSTVKYEDRVDAIFITEKSTEHSSRRSPDLNFCVCIMLEPPTLLRILFVACAAARCAVAEAARLLHRFVFMVSVSEAGPR